MRLTDEERDEVDRRAAAAGVTMARFLVEPALVGDRPTVSQRQALVNAFVAAKSWPLRATR